MLSLLLRGHSQRLPWQSWLLLEPISRTTGESPEELVWQTVQTLCEVCTGICLFLSASEVLLGDNDHWTGVLLSDWETDVFYIAPSSSAARSLLVVVARLVVYVWVHTLFVFLVCLFQLSPEGDQSGSQCVCVSQTPVQSLHCSIVMASLLLSFTETKMSVKDCQVLEALNVWSDWFFDPIVPVLFCFTQTQFLVWQHLLTFENFGLFCLMKEKRVV